MYKAGIGAIDGIFFPYSNIEHAQKLVVVGTGIKASEIQEYIKKLNERFFIPIDYLQV